VGKYDGLHRRLRKHWGIRVKTGRVWCTRYGHPLFPDCPGLIAPDAEWDLGHDDHDPTKWTGPEHRGTCNRRAGALKRNGELTDAQPRSRKW
jgi:hypothetical protein